MGPRAVHTALDASVFIGVLKAASALIPQQVERAEAEEAVEPLRVRFLVAREVFAIHIAKESFAIPHGRPRFRGCPTPRFRW